MVLAMTTSPLGSDLSPVPAQPPAGHLTIAGCEIRRDADGRYCLNDLHKASGGLRHHQPAKYLANKRTKASIAHLAAEAAAKSPNSETLKGPNSDLLPVTITKGRNGATYVIKELVYDYAMWISPAFQFAVIRAYDALVTGTLKTLTKPLTQAEKFWFNRRPQWRQIRPLALDGYTYRQISTKVGRSPASVGNSVRRMVQIGLIDPVQLVCAHYQPATAARLISTNQLCLDWGMPS